MQQKNPPLLGLNSKSMAGWSMLADGSALDCAEAPQKNETDGSSIDLELPIRASKRCILDLPDKLRCWFDQFLAGFLKEICAQGVLRPLPPMIGNGQCVDLLKLFLVVRERGGFNALSRITVWDSVAEECGLGLSLGWAVKLVYVKYLYLLERVVDSKGLEWSLASSGIDLGEQLMDLEDEFTGLFSGISDQKLKDGMYPNVELSTKSFKDSNDLVCAVTESDRLKKRVVDLDSGSVVNGMGARKSCNDDVRCSVPLSRGDRKSEVDFRNTSLDLKNNMEDVGKLSDNVEVKTEVGESGRGKKNDDCDEDVMILDPASVEESPFCKRKRESLSGSEVGESGRGKKNDDCDEDVMILDPASVEESSFHKRKRESLSGSEVEESGRVKIIDGCDGDVTNLDPTAAEEVSSSCKKKRESLCGMLDWVRMIAKNPCDLAVGSLPERSKWKSFGNEEKWMQVLLAREDIFLKRHDDSGAEQSNWQKNQRMHPSMYDDHLGSSYNLRERQRLEKKLLSGRTMSPSGACLESSSASDLDESSPGMEGGKDQLLGNSGSPGVFDEYPRSRIPLGSKHQAHVPEWNGEVSESDSKWLGSTVWPLEKPENRYLIERDPIGKGRQESCGCQVPGSVECVRFHISEKRLRVKRELGSAFYQWKFNQMGEEVGLPWTAEEEKKFRDIVKSNPSSLERSFWDEIVKSFAKKSRGDLVSYYFNVFLLQRRGYQNRFTPNNIDSDDEELESGSVTNGVGHEVPKSSKSILKSPHKPHAKCR